MYWHCQIISLSKWNINERFIFGRQVQDGEYRGVDKVRTIKSYQIPFVDNVIKEGEDTLRPLVLSRTPDFIVKPGVKDNDLSSQTAEAVTDMVNKVLTSRDLKKVLTKGFRHHPIYYTGVIKWRWDPQKGKNGDIVFEVIHPRNIRFDIRATENNQRVMKIIIHKAICCSNSSFIG